MKSFIIGFMTVSALLGVQTIKAQTVDEVVDKYVDALGGKEKLASLKTVTYGRKL